MWIHPKIPVHFVIRKLFYRIQWQFLFRQINKLRPLGEYKGVFIEFSCLKISQEIIKAHDINKKKKEGIKAELNERRQSK